MSTGANKKFIQLRVMWDREVKGLTIEQDWFNSNTSYLKWRVRSKFVVLVFKIRLVTVDNYEQVELDIPLHLNFQVLLCPPLQIARR